MGIITLTDRISVRVSAKNDTQSNNYKKATGGTIGKTLGNEDISDELKTQLGNTTKPVITDEDGNAWISMADIIAAGKAMYANGAFDEKHLGYDGYNVIGSPLVLSSGSVNIPSGKNWDGADRYISIFCTGGAPVYYGRGADNFFEIIAFSLGSFYMVESTSPSAKYYATSYSNNSKVIYIPYNENPSLSMGSFGNGGSGDYLGLPQLTFTKNDNNSQRCLCEWGYIYGDIREGGSLIDWTKSDAEIEEDIRDLHETWDVSEHEGAVMANGTYVLAGPIEFNPGDPTQGPPGSVG